MEESRFPRILLLCTALMALVATVALAPAVVAIDQMSDSVGASEAYEYNLRNAMAKAEDAISRSASLAGDANRDKMVEYLKGLLSEAQKLLTAVDGGLTINSDVLSEMQKYTEYLNEGVNGMESILGLNRTMVEDPTKDDPEATQTTQTAQNTQVAQNTQAAAQTYAVVRTANISNTEETNSDEENNEDAVETEENDENTEEVETNTTEEEDVEVPTTGGEKSPWNLLTGIAAVALVATAAGAGAITIKKGIKNDAKD